MNTKLIKNDLNEADLDEPARCLADGGLVVFPTETVYGLGANALDEDAVAAIFAAKGRPSDNPLIVHIWDASQLSGLVRDVPASARRLMDRFWPGPLTLVMARADGVPNAVTAGLDTVGVRMPSHPIARELLRRAEVPVAAPSANTSTRPSPTTAQHVADDLDGRVDYIIDGGPCDVGVESTVLDVTGEIPVILRPGGVSREELESVVGRVDVDPGLTRQDVAPRSPGMKYKHYAPSCEMAIVTGDQIADAIRREIDVRPGARVCVLTAGSGQLYPGAFAVTDGGKTPAQYARRLFAALRDFDRLGAEFILAEFPFGDAGLEPAIRNRIMKSAGGNVIHT